MRPPPQSLELTQVTEWSSGAVSSVQDSLVAEEPLEIRVNGVPVSVTMRTPGHDRELALGFLFTEGIIDSCEQIEQVDHLTTKTTTKRNIVEVRLANADFDSTTLQRNFFATSSCGICGKATIETVRRRGLRSPNQSFRISPEVLCKMPEALRAQQALFDRTGGLHAAALFDKQGDLVVLREDVGRHNAVDKIAGWALLQNRVPLSDNVLLVSGRGGFEIIQKALAVGIPVIASVSAPSSLAVKLAREFGLTLIGFLRGERFVIYSASHRCLPQSGDYAKAS
ncbi:formate dehydrogenase accessory sulfurtransferase FdhD [Occallatibacter riparius]|uniref:Sulfur carrier protein FdhD n=1 Tax=Occallatibacter riparius TaxID=1002689 RepID=A0A9J7BP94_9BACT|nr:formate dehydrogenase accessory sulfurtransferase FdhD [Occallatibacter riparius]UWZ84571.1 formate dehydrogenase accessory sulfurtransferase FdhD [Occallatibacter riparius]